MRRFQLVRPNLQSSLRILLGVVLALALKSAAVAGPFEDGQAAFRNGDYAAALRLWRPLAEQGHAKAQVNLGTMYTMGRGVPQDNAEALKWIRLAAERGDALAQVKLGGVYERGEGVPHDDAEAVRWYRKAAEQGRYEGQAQLGVLYTKGKGVPQDYVQAYRWLSLAHPQIPASEQNLRDLVTKLLAEVESELPQQAQAERGQPKPGETIFLSVENEMNFNGDVPIWQSKDARVEGFRLVAEGVHRTAPNKFLSLISCAVPTGTKAEIISYDSEARNGLGVGTVRVTEGQHSGCTGTVTTEQMSPTRETNQVGAGSSPQANEKQPAHTPPVGPQARQAQSQDAGEDLTVVVAEFSGKGMNTTRPFTLDGPWEVQWSSDEFIQIFLSKADQDEVFPDVIANQIEAGSGSAYQPRGGSYYLKISAMGKWHIKVVAMKSPGEGRGSDGHTWDDRPGVRPEQVVAPQPPIPPARPQNATPESREISELPPGETASGGDTITATEIAAGISRDKTELEQETWWDEHMLSLIHI